ncbi:uncharacterized protein C22orf15 homolog isoform X2 [Lemur catta]|uniref:uncharacterized protein C22orf15 homolog isoform X2 n=1 Tax=Lemur catta TaxID=9447 RepID=UPI001E26AEA8|nr:uncharacterized protein C22orf15 homolog isoform X2 [Lemur catta]
MFITVMFGAGCWELVNPWCNLVTLTAHLRQRGKVPPDATIALLSEDGHLGERAEPPPAMSPSWRTWMASVQSWQRSCAGCRTSQGARAGGGAWAHAVATGSKAPLQGPEGWAPCRPGLASWGQEPGANRQQPSRIPLAESGIAEKLHQQEGQGHRQDVRPLGAPKTWVQRKGSRGRDEKGGRGQASLRRGDNRLLPGFQPPDSDALGVTS